MRVENLHRQLQHPRRAPAPKGLPYGYKHPHRTPSFFICDKPAAIRRAASASEHLRIICEHLRLEPTGELAKMRLIQPWKVRAALSWQHNGKNTRAGVAAPHPEFRAVITNMQSRGSNSERLASPRVPPEGRNFFRFRRRRGL